jgi:hypothetical protein
MLSHHPVVNEPFVLTKCDYFVDVQVWPLSDQCDARGWLSNFEGNDRAYALQLLNSFMFFRQPMMDAMFMSAVNGLSQRLCAGQTFAAAQRTWRSFVDSLLVTRVTGESPSDTDSSFHFARLARQILPLSEPQVVSPEECVKVLLSDARPVVFLDDFVGSGHQFVTTWHREIDVLGGGQTSFERIARVRRGVAFYYCPLICTQLGMDTIKRDCVGVTVSPAHILPSSYSAIVPDSIIWPASLLVEGIRFVERASARAGIPDDEWRGYADLGLALAFEHYTTPDATLPFFFWEQNGWKPLVHRR